MGQIELPYKKFTGLPDRAQYELWQDFQAIAKTIERPTKLSVTEYNLPSGQWSQIAFNGTTWAVGGSVGGGVGNRLAISNDLSNWVVTNTSVSGTCNFLVYGNGRFNSLGNWTNTYVNTSTDGATWTTTDLGALASDKDLFIFKDKYYKINSTTNATVSRSNDMLTWVVETITFSAAEPVLAPGSSTISGVLNTGSGRSFLWSDGGAFQSGTYTGTSFSQTIAKVIYAEDRFIGYGSNGVVIESFDGKAWTYVGAGHGILTAPDALFSTASGAVYLSTNSKVYISTDKCRTFSNIYDGPYSVGSKFCEGQGVVAGTVPSANKLLVFGTIDRLTLGPGAIQNIEIGPDAVGTDNIKNNSVTTAKLADNSVTSAKIVDGTIVTADVADGAVTTAKLADGSVTTIKLADNSVTSAKIADGTIATGDIADNAITTAKVVDGAITAAKVAADVATQAELDAEAALARNADNLTSGTVADARIASTIARDSEVTAAVATHEAASDPHTGYQKESEKNAQNGYAGLDNDTNARVPAARLGTGTADSTVFLRGDRAWTAVPSSTDEALIWMEVAP